MTEAEFAAVADGEWAIVELFGHQKLVGRIAEVERFGTKMLALEPLFNGEILPPAYHGGAAIYRLTPCDAAVAWREQPKQLYQLPPSIKCVVPPTALPPVEPAPRWNEAEVEADQDDDIEF